MVANLGAALFLLSVAAMLADLAITERALRAGAREVIWGFLGQERAATTAAVGNLAIFVGVMLGSSYFVGAFDDWRTWACYLPCRLLVTAITYRRAREQERIRYGR